MPKSVIKEEFKTTLIAFNGGGSKALGERDDIDALAIIARKSNNPNLLKLFKVLPSLQELQTDEVEKQLKKKDAAAIRVTKAQSKKED
jgi:hypothetical protein